MLACSLVTRTCLKTTRGLISGTFRRLTSEVLLGGTKPWKSNCSLIWKLFKFLMTLLADLFEVRGCWHIGLRWAIVALWATCFMNLSHMSSVRITDVKDSCESFTEVKDSHIFVTSEKFVRILHRGEGLTRTCHICEKVAQILHVWQIRSNFSHMWQICLTFTFERICHMCEEFTGICHTCEKFEQILHRYDKYVQILHTSKIRHLWKTRT